MMMHLKLESLRIIPCDFNIFIQFLFAFYTFKNTLIIIASISLILIKPSKITCRI